MKRVRDIMQADVITVAPGTSVREIAQLLVRESIGGVPVVDDAGVVVGVVSGTDIVRCAARDPEGEVGFEMARTPVFEPEEAEEGEDRSPFWAPDQLPDWVRPVLVGDQLDELDAAAIMTPATFSVPPSLPVSEFAEFLIRGRIHRALVEEGDRLVGIATTFDALRALADGDGA